MKPVQGPSTVSAATAKPLARPEVVAMKHRIDQTLDVDWVEWRMVGLFVIQLEMTLDAVVDLGDVSVALYFLEQMPTVFDRVHDETEMAEFCAGLGRAIVKLGAGDLGVARQMLDAFSRDQYGALGEFPKIIAGIARTREERRALAAIYQGIARSSERFQADDLLTVARALEEECR